MQKDEKILHLPLKIHKYFNNNLKHLFIESEKKQIINIVNPRYIIECVSLFFYVFVFLLCLIKAIINKLDQE